MVKPTKPNSSPANGSVPAWMIFAGLAAAAFAIYWPVLKFGFINYDDPYYITDNLVVLEGLSVSGFWWAFTTGHAANWHPVTWLSHMTDATLFGGNAGGHHLVNVLWHAVNAGLLFMLLRKLTGASWRSVVVAALWALHPLHVESVAWVSERKDVLSTFFGLLTLICYASYAQARGAGREASGPTSNAQRPPRFFYALALVFFALGLMSKPMLVTLPCVLLLLDFWPLGRMQNVECRMHNLRGLFVEKIPFFALSAASCVVTVIVQKAGGAVQTMELVPMIPRMENAAVAYARYLGKTFWPVDLVVPYVYPGRWPLIWALGAVCLLLLVSAVVWWQRRRAPYGVFGWLWFLGTLVPVIGLLQVGGQSMADRYTYLPHIGLFIALVWGAAAGLRRWALGVRLGVAVIILVACAARTHDQLRHWRSTETLFRHTLAVAPENELAMQQLGILLLTENRSPAEALALLGTYARNNPNSADAANNYGLALQDAGRVPEAIVAYEYALRLKPEMAEAHLNLASALFAAAGREPEKALKHYETALRLNPELADGRGDFARALLAAGRADEAIVQLRQWLAQNPKQADVHAQLAVALAGRQQFSEAETHFREALRLAPGEATVHFNYGKALAMQPRHADAIREFTEALRLSPQLAVARTELADAHCQWGLQLAGQQLKAGAILQWRAALRAEPEHRAALNGLAWTLATDKDSGVRDGAEALRLAGRLVQLTQTNAPAALDTLAAAYAETGDYAQAIRTVQTALALLTTNHAAQVELQEHLQTFQARQPWRE